MREKFSAGEWHACDKGNCVCGQVWCDDYPVAIVTRGKWGDDFPSLKLTGPSLQLIVEPFMDQITYGEVPEATAMANARLIAMSPQLYAYVKVRADCGDKEAKKLISGVINGVENPAVKQIQGALDKLGHKKTGQPEKAPPR